VLKPIKMPFWGGVDLCEPKESYIICGSISPWEGVLLRGMCLPIIMYPRLSAFRILCLPPLANMPAQHKQQTNAFADVRHD